MNCQCRECQGRECQCKFCYERNTCSYVMIDECRWEKIKENRSEKTIMKFEVILRNNLQMSLSARRANRTY